MEPNVNNNEFVADIENYNQKYDLSMRYPLSAITATLFMEYFETEILPTTFFAESGVAKICR